MISKYNFLFNPINEKEKNNNIINDLQDYMFTSKNLLSFTKHMIQNFDEKNNINLPKSSNKNIFIKNKDETNSKNNYKVSNKKEETMYKPKQKDSLFWCLYILKHGYSNYEMEIYNKYFTIEKSEKFNYIELIRKKKDLLKLHKVKPLTEIEDDLANKEKISIKTFFALCIIENLNVLLVNNRKVYEILCTDIDDNNPINIIHRFNENFEHSIELNPTNEIIKNYRENYYKMESFDSKLKSIGSYKLEDLMDLCKKLNINIENYKKENNNKKMTKKDIYELLVLNF